MNGMNGMELAAALAEGLVNRYLALDEEARGILAELDGRSLEVRVTGTGLVLRISVEGGRLAITTRGGEDADVSVQGPPASLLAALARRSGDGIAGEDVAVTGDVAVLQRLRAVFSRLEVDWEEQVSQLVGDVAAHQVGNMVRQGLRWGAEVQRTAERNVGEYVTEEARLTPSRWELEDFAADVDTLRDDVERMAQRVERLARQRGRGS